MFKVMSAGDVETHNSTSEDFWDGQFHWSAVPYGQNIDENDNFGGTFEGMKLEYPVSDDDIGTVLTFEASTREAYGAIDMFVFSTSDELLEIYTQEDLDEFFVSGPPQLLPEDFNGNGSVDFADFVLFSNSFGQDVPPR